MSVLQASGAAVARSDTLRLAADVITGRAETDEAGDTTLKLITVDPTEATGPHGHRR